jgi:hypothetical protein
MIIASGMVTPDIAETLRQIILKTTHCYSGIGDPQRTLAFVTRSIPTSLLVLHEG